MRGYYQRPLILAEKEIEYEKHLQRINDILRQKRRQRSFRDLSSKRKMKSATIKRNFDEQRIEQQNEKLLARLLDISQRKSISFSNQLEYTPTAPIVNPYRKKIMQQIHEENQQLAERLISKQSDFNPSKVHKSIQEYERVKRSMMRNKRINLPVLRRDSSLEL